MTRLSSARLFSLAIVAVFASCSGGGSSVAGSKTGGDFVVLSTEPVDNAQLFLNDSIRIDFSNPVDLSSVDLTTFSFQVFDQIGTPISEPVAGSFQLGASPGDAEVGRRLEFVPVLPTNDQYTNGGFRPGRTYQVQLVGGNRNNGTVLRDTSGKGLALPQTFTFTTADGTTPSQLFRNTLPGGPRRTAFEITPTPDTTGVVLNKLGGPPVEVRLHFDQPLNPSSGNVPVAVETDPLLRNGNSRGRVYLEYDDPDPLIGNNTWIPADAELEFNGVLGSTLVLRPLGVLPNNADIRVIVSPTLEDISGESNVANVAYEEVFGTFKTKRAYEQQFDGLVSDFIDSSNVDPTAPFSEPMAEVGPGYVKAGFDFEGNVTGAEFDPSAPNTVLNTDFTLVTPKNGAPYQVSGGVFNFANVNIQSGKHVQGTGTNPMVWLVAGKFECAGTLSVRGGNGTGVNTSGNANVAKDGGAGNCGGGDGGDGSPSSIMRDIVGGTGNGPLNVSGTGGSGGTLACQAGCGRGSGGGGGSLATQGDPNFKQKVQPAGTVAIGGGNPPPTNPFPMFPQQTGIGGPGCAGLTGRATRGLEGGVPGPTVFVDSRNDNNYWGVGLRMDQNLRITGELAAPIGGGGGGGGGDFSYNNECSDEDPTFENDSSGGGGGGGGGVLIVKALGPIVIYETGRIVADGGSGGGGEPSSSSTQGGGGGGGAGGMVILMSADSIDIHVPGNTYANNDYDFSISADGGVTVSGSQPPVVEGKYPASGTSINTGWRETYDSAPLGGFGGMGIVQLMVPPGDPASTTDNTNTILDDKINIYSSAAQLVGTQKQARLAWRGFPNAFGVGVDDAGNTITIGDNEGDIRPSPILLPTPFATKSRVRSKWIDTGATARRPLIAPDELPRGILVGSGVQEGPTYEWQGTEGDPLNFELGYAKWEVNQGRSTLLFNEVVAATNILTTNANSTFLARPAYRVQLTQSTLGQAVDRFSQYEAELLASDGSVVGSHRILSHTADELVLSPESGPLSSDAVQVRIIAKFFDIMTDGQAGLGGSYVGASGARVPIANVRIGFAFHANPQNSNAARYPATEGTFAYDLSDPAVQEAVRAIGASFVQWDILFDTAYKTSQADGPPDLNPETPRPELQFLRLPFRF